MKRFFFSIIALAAAAVSCTQSALLETPTLDGTPVSFSPYTGRTPVTKATSIADEAGLNAEGGFNVYCFLNGDQTKPLLADEPVTMTDGVWGYTNTIFWPASGSLDFVAYSANAKDYLTDASSTGFTFTVPESIDEQVDLLATAYQAGKTATSEGVSGGDVTLKFFHLLSRVGFKVQTGSTKAFTIKSLSITGDTPTKGTLEFTDFTGDAVPALTPEAVVEDKAYFFVNSDAVMAGGASDATAITGMDSKYLMVMPHDAAGHTISITYTIGDSEIEKTATAELPAEFVFAQGKAYEFILKISTSSLTFDVMEEDWNEAGDTDLQPEKPKEEDAPTETNEWGIVTRFISYDYDKNEATFEITVSKSGHDGLRMILATDQTTLSYQANTTVIPFKDNVEPPIGKHKVTIKGDNRLKQNKAAIYYFASTYNSTVFSAMKKHYAKGTGNEKSFSTLSSNSAEPNAPTDNPTEDPIVTIYNISVDQAAKTASVTGNFIDGGHKITSRGFCWMTGGGTPTTDNEKIICGESDPFSATITGLATGINRCRAYVTTEDGNTYYSELRTIEIEPTVNEEDNTGSGSWGNGGNEDFN